MPTTLSFKCPHCRHKYEITGVELLGNKVKCGNCDKKFTVKSKMATVSLERKEI